jgi:bromodomain-containing factor 1
LESREATRLGPEEKRAQQKLMKVAEEYGLFANPVSELEAPGYSSMIAIPMDFSTVRDRMRQYRTLAELANDLFLCYDSCEHYNSDESIFYAEAQRQRQVVQQRSMI